LDIGGGVGAIQWEFLKKGGSSTQGVDSSTAYLEVAKSYAMENNFSDQTRLLFGDMVDKSNEIEVSDLVTLDKVVCCYPDYKLLLATALSKCNERIVLTYPIGGPISKFVNFLSEIYLYFKNNPFRSFVHSPREIENFIVSQGFTPVQKTISFPWHVQAYKKEETISS
jgi:hypothetical protein